jgi:hypothetical protein
LIARRRGAGEENACGYCEPFDAGAWGCASPMGEFAGRFRGGARGLARSKVGGWLGAGAGRRRGLGDGGGGGAAGLAMGQAAARGRALGGGGVKAGGGLKSFQCGAGAVTREPGLEALNVGSSAGRAGNSLILLVFYTGRDLARRLLKSC